VDAKATMNIFRRHEKDWEGEGGTISYIRWNFYGKPKKMNCRVYTAVRPDPWWESPPNFRGAITRTWPDRSAPTRNAYRDTQWMR
jgi:hypothetical protein